MRYGIIGNCKTAALVHESGSIDWCCLPNFDSPSAFARLLDPQGGHFQVSLANPAEVCQTYLPATNILQTTFDDGENAFLLIDFMPRYREGHVSKRPLEIHRILRPLKGHPQIRVLFSPRLNYARGTTHIKQRPSVITASHALESLFFYSSLPLDAICEQQSVPLHGDQFLLLAYHERIEDPNLHYCLEMLEKTTAYWQTWSHRCQLSDLHREEVLRSALTLKLMTCEDTGAIIAAPTTSLPEIMGGKRNWDYRYCWLRDASLMLEALKSIGHYEEARAFIHFLLRLLESKQTKIQIVYGIDGHTDLTESSLDHLQGFEHSRPVRIGNQASFTRQNDIFGEVLSALHLYFCHYRLEPMTDDVWALVKFLANTTSKEWADPDAGIWEFRHQQAQFTFSKVLSWVALDRALAIAEHIGKRYMRDLWKPVADAIRNDIEAMGWNERVDAYTQSYGSSSLDASLLLMHRYGYIGNDHPRWVATVRQSAAHLLRHGYAFRYTSSDDFGKPETAFIVATLWLAKALHSIGDRATALELFERVLAKANHVGLLAEGIDPVSGEMRGNFPQAYSHMAVINTAKALSSGLGC